MKLTPTQQALYDFALRVKAQGISTNIPGWVADCQRKERDVSQWIGVSGLFHACSFSVDGAFVSNGGANPFGPHLSVKIPGCGARTVRALYDKGLIYSNGYGQWCAV